MMNEGEVTTDMRVMIDANGKIGTVVDKTETCPVTIDIKLDDGTIVRCTADKISEAHEVVVRDDATGELRKATDKEVRDIDEKSARFRALAEAGKDAANPPEPSPVPDAEMREAPARDVLHHLALVEMCIPYSLELFVKKDGRGRPIEGDGGGVIPFHEFKAELPEGAQFVRGFIRVEEVRQQVLGVNGQSMTPPRVTLVVALLIDPTARPRYYHYALSLTNAAMVAPPDEMPEFLDAIVEPFRRGDGTVANMVGLWVSDRPMRLGAQQRESEKPVGNDLPPVSGEIGGG